LASLSYLFTVESLESVVSGFVLSGDIMDALYIVLAVGFFAVTALLIPFFEKLRRH